MKVIEYNFDLGKSIFELNELSTDFHSHPAIEIIVCSEGTFSVYGDNYSLENISACIIKSNVNHKIIAPYGSFTLSLIDCVAIDENRLLSSLNLGQDEIQSTSFSIAKNIICASDFSMFKPKISTRISEVVSFIRQSNSNELLKRSDLASIAHLSPSRLSHLFKEEMGVSLSMYIKWCKMNLALKYMLSKGTHLGNTALNSGFYDSADFSKQFKSLFGVSPSFAYNNSTIIQS